MRIRDIRMRDVIWKTPWYFVNGRNSFERSNSYSRKRSSKVLIITYEN